MKKTIIFLFSLVMSLGLFAQSPMIKFEKSVHDYGKIQEKDGLATVLFTFTNMGDAPLVISRVQASCGCTTPSFTKEPVLPGENGTITVSYNPLGRPGNFVKSILVHHNGEAKPYNLTIKGNVIPKPVVER